MPADTIAAMTHTRYISTPIYYVNDRPHIGHVYTTTVCDVFARMQRFLGRDVFFLTGTDEHAAKVADAAAERGLTPQQWADQNAAEFQQVFDLVGITSDDFIRTSEDRHKDRVTTYVSALLKTGDVYLGEYEGWYDPGEEEYVPEGRAAANNFKSEISRRDLIRKKEKNYFFKLSAFRERLIAHFEANPTFVQPDARRNEIVNRIRDAEDVPISRTGAGGWGIQVPGDDEQTIYVWIDALFNYLTTVDTEDRRKYWPCNIHVIAKDILWFHAAIWPAVLIALRNCEGYDWVELPKQIYAHSFYISEGQKMSKTLGNFIDLEAIQSHIDTYTLDALRYYLAAHGPLGATDANFTIAHLHEIYSSDLVNSVGNCASRVTAMINKYFNGEVPSESPGDSRITFDGYDWPALTQQAVIDASNAIERLDLATALECALNVIRKVDVFINDTEPFKLAKDESPEARQKLGAILYQCAEVVRIASLLLWPACPGKMESLWQALSLDIDPNAGDLCGESAWGRLQPGSNASKVALFPRIEAPAEPATTAL